MSLKDKTIFIVGSVPGQTAEGVFRLVAPEIGNMAVGVSDGEPGYRAMWDGGAVELFRRRLFRAA